jgi:hypothetical protein
VRYNFAKQLAKGKEVEDKLDLFFSPQFDRIEEVGMASERQGIDRLFYKNGKVYTVEYKADFKSYGTGNCYAETVAYGRYNDEGNFVVGKLGWMHTSMADYLIYVVMHPEDVDGLGMAYITEPQALRVWIDGWAERYRKVQVKNNGFQGRGILVPLRELERVSVKKLLVN